MASKGTETRSEARTGIANLQPRVLLTELPPSPPSKRAKTDGLTATTGSPSNSKVMMEQASLELTESIYFDIILLDNSCTADGRVTVDEGHFTHCVVRIVDNVGTNLVSFDCAHGFTVDREKIDFLEERKGKRMVFAPNLGCSGCVFGQREQVIATRSEILNYLREQCQKVKHTLLPPTNCFYPVILLRNHPKYKSNVDSFSNRFVTCVGLAIPTIGKSLLIQNFGLCLTE